MFEKCTRMKLRFGSPQGSLTVEDLWELPLTSTRLNQATLNNVAKVISRQLKSESEEDFVNPATKANETLQLALDVVKHIIQVKQTENQAALALADRKEKKARLLELIQKKQDMALEGKPLEELEGMLAAL